MNLPESTSILPRPVYARHLRRVFNNINPLPAASNAEKADAILVLSMPQEWLEAEHEMWVEATRILDETENTP